MNQPIYLITGPSGAGKTTLSNYLTEAGHQSIDVDSVPGVCYFVNKNNKPVPYPAGADAAWWATHNYVWELDRLQRHIRSFDAALPLYICGNAGNIDKAWELFAAAFYLDIPRDIMVARLAGTDRENSFGARLDEQDQLLRWVDEFKANMLAKGAVKIDATKPAKTVASTILQHVETAKA